MCAYNSLNHCQQLPFTHNNNHDKLGLVALRLSLRRNHRPNLRRLRPPRLPNHESPPRHGPLPHQIPLQRLPNLPMRLHDHRGRFPRLP